MSTTFEQSVLTNLKASAGSERSSSGKNIVPPTHSHDTEIDVDHIGLQDLGIHTVRLENILRNPSVAVLYELALQHEQGSAVSSTGALMCRSGDKTGRSPKDKRVVKEPTSESEVWWGRVNIPMEERSFLINRERAIDYLNLQPRLFVVDGYAAWHPKFRMKMRIICSRAYHALFMENMLIRPTREELAHFGTPDFVIYNAGSFPSNKYTKDVTSSTSIDINFGLRQMVILGTQYAGEMKKGVFTLMHYYLPKMGALSLHSSANEGPNGDVSIFFGLSGTGKTTLSTEPHRKLIGDDEHGWFDGGVFNIEGGCYAKCIGLSKDTEPEIFNAIRFGAVLENVVYDSVSREVDYSSAKITENTRCSYPIEFIPNSKVPCIAGHPKNLILLSCDAFGVLPAVSRLTPEQTMYYFISGYTAKVAGTEVGVTEPTATFSACFGDAFIVHHPTKYAEMLAKLMKEHRVNAWLLNTGWNGGAYGVGSRIKLRYTRAIIDAIHSGELEQTYAKGDFTTLPKFGLQYPNHCPKVPDEILNPRWKDSTGYDAALDKVAHLFTKNFSQYTASETIIQAGPKV